MTDTNQIPDKEKSCVVPIEEQRLSALKHYEEASSAIHHWSSFVENAIKSYSPEAARYHQPPVEMERLVIWNDIDNELVDIDKPEDAKKYVYDNYVDGNEMHPDFSSFPILKKVGSVGCKEDGDTVTGIYVSMDAQPASPVVDRDEKVFDKFGHHNIWKYCPGCGIEWSIEEGFDQFGCSSCGYVKTATSPSVAHPPVRWVKASERLPESKPEMDNNREYSFHCRYEGKKVVLYFWSFNWWGKAPDGGIYGITEKVFNRIEWLDETPSEEQPKENDPELIRLREENFLLKTELETLKHPL